MSARFPWDTLRSILGGRSAVDVPRLHCEDLRSAEAFLECYGFDWTEPSHREELEVFRADAVAFLEDELLDDEEILPEVRQQTDPRQLLVWASSRESSPRQSWTCALLRIAHTLAHCRSHFNETYGEQIRSQILQRFEPHLHITSGGLLLGDGPDAVELVDFEVKASKPVRSVALKLLHKVENVAEDVFDRVGVRFITRERFDTLLAVRYLRENNVFMFTNVKPSRSRNTLIDFDWLQDLTSSLNTEVAEGRMTEAEYLEMLRSAVAAKEYPSGPSPGINPHSAASYHSLQFTCRQMIRVATADGEEEIRFFFPFEIQVLDDESYRRSRSGYASHDLYKARQRIAVRRRVLGHLAQ